MPRRSHPPAHDHVVSEQFVRVVGSRELFSFPCLHADVLLLGVFPRTHELDSLAKVPGHHLTQTRRPPEIGVRFDDYNDSGESEGRQQTRDVIVDQSLLGVKEDGICPRNYKQIPPRQQTNALTGGADILDSADLFSDTTQTDKHISNPLLALF